MAVVSDNSGGWGARRRLYERLSTRLAALDDSTLAARVAAAPLTAGFHADSGPMELDGVAVFVKKLPLTHLERSAGRTRPTANLFGLPLYYQYGVGSSGFGAWRELAANVMATRWVLSGACANFPLLYHWRVLPRPEAAPPTPAEEAALDRYVAYWNGSEAIRERRAAMTSSPASVVLFLEHFPQALWPSLTELAAAGGDAAEQAVMRADDQLAATVSFMNDRGMLHFDMHYYNAVTDGENVYLADFGLAIHSGFELSNAERDFFDEHRLYDRCFVADQFAHFVDTLGDPGALDPSVRERLQRYRPVAQAMWDLRKALRTDKTVRYPAAELRRLAAERGLAGRADD